MEVANPEKQIHKPTGSFLNGIFLGVLAGATAFYLMGTEKGKKSRNKLLAKGRRAIDFLEKNINEAEEKGQQLKPKVVKIKNEAESKGKKVVKTIEKLKKNFFFKKGKVLK